ncbi:family 16 glycosylhydrolase [Lentimonas sp. CC10]|nr:family 16 glycosylhydrolase [Lentimonas sp. CC10]CAA6689514.1 Unannotated [Lentimonas sp. CC10]CAA6691971.1 Unannotated [Lentimonas sp. CC19]CAA7070549.1 Unannotated [Lentimonas sp. CC11]
MLRTIKRCLCSAVFIGMLHISVAGAVSLVPYAEDALSSLSTRDARIESLESSGQLKVVFESGGYPNLSFPIPADGWDLSAYWGIEIEIENLSDAPIRAAMRIDNPGDEREHFWNTETILLQPRESKTIQSVFGKNNGKSGYPLDASRVSGLQVFLLTPKSESVLLIGEPRGYGAPDSDRLRPRYSAPEARAVPVECPDWLGARPPVEGDWVVTFDEDFDASELNPLLWSQRHAMGGPHPLEKQRYRDENLSIDEGVATIRAEYNPGHQYDDSKLPERDFAATMLTGYDLWRQRYGYFEMRTKLPTAGGLMPVFGLIPDRGSDTGLNMHQRRTSHDFEGKGMEIDIFNHRAEWGAGRVGYSTRWGGPAGTHIQKNWGNAYVYYGPTQDGWHTFGLLWEPGKLTWYIDGIKKEEWTDDAIADLTCYLSLTLPMGRNSPKGIDQPALPDAWKIDYVRAWQLAERD